MRQLSFGSPGPELDPWVASVLREIENASNEDAQQVFDDFTVSGTFTTTRTLDADTATLSDLIAFVATLVSDIQKIGKET